MEKNPNIHIITVSGPSLSGKTELTKILNKEYGFESVISHTTRPQRGQEENNIDYYFIDDAKFNKIEMVQTTNFNGFKYGVSKEEINKKGEKPILWVIAPESINQVEKYCKENNFKLTRIFVSNPKDIILERLFTRFKEDNQGNPKIYVKRLNSIIQNEMKWIDEAIEDALNDNTKYDLKFFEFNQDNTKETINKIINNINKNNNIVKLKSI